MMDKTESFGQKTDIMNKLITGGFMIDLNERNQKQNELFYSDFNCDDEPEDDEDELSLNEDIEFNEDVDEPNSDDGSFE